MLELIQELGDELQTRHNWSFLHTDWVFTVTSDPMSQPFPADYDRLESSSSVWRSSSQLTPLLGPVSNDSWHDLLNVPGTFPGYWRLVSGTMQTLGVSVSETVTVPYVSTNWILDLNGATTKSSFTADTDTTMFDFQLMATGTRWKWKASKGLEYGEDLSTFERWLEREIAADRAARPVSISNIVSESDAAVSSWPGTIIPLP